MSASRVFNSKQEPTSLDSPPPSSPSYSLSPTAPLFPNPSSHLTTLTTPGSIIPITTPLAAAPLSPPQPGQSHPLTHALTVLARSNNQHADLNYPSIPPPSLASSLGSGSPVVPTLRLPPNSRRQSRGEKLGRVAKTTSLRRRDEAGSTVQRRTSTSRGGVGMMDDELEEIGKAYSDEDKDEDVLDDDDKPCRPSRSGVLEIGRGRGMGRGMGLGLSGAR